MPVAEEYIALHLTLVADGLGGMEEGKLKVMAGSKARVIRGRPYF